MPQTLTERVTALERIVDVLTARLVALDEKIAEVKNEQTVMTRELNDLKRDFERVTALHQREFEELRAWREEWKRGNEEFGRKMWLIVPPLLAAVVSSALTGFITYLLRRYLLSAVPRKGIQMKMCLYFVGIIACVICLPEQKPIRARDSDQLELGIMVRTLDTQQALLSQLRHTGRIGGPEFGWEIQAATVKDGVLVSPTFLDFDDEGQPDVWWTAETLRFKVDAKRSILLIQAKEVFGFTQDGSTAQFGSRNWEWQLRQVKMP